MITSWSSSLPCWLRKNFYTDRFCESIRHFCMLVFPWFARLDPFRFFAHFIASIREKFPNFGKTIAIYSRIKSSKQARYDSLVAAIVNETYEHIREHFIIVLDELPSRQRSKRNYYFISRFYPRGRRELPSYSGVPLSSDLARYAASGGAIHGRWLKFEELTFLPDEIQSLIMQNYNLVYHDRLLKNWPWPQKGWITGLLLSTKRCGWVYQRDGRVARVSRVGLYDYLAHQVLDQTDTWGQEFLLTTYCLKIWYPSMWRDLLIQTSYGESVRLRNPKYLFVLLSARTTSGFVIITCLRTFSRRVWRREPARRIRILRRLVEIYAERRDWERAYSTCQQLNDVKTTHH